MRKNSFNVLIDGLTLLVLHLALHWRWVCATARRLVRRGAHGPGRGPRDDIYGLAVLALLVATFGGFLLLAGASTVTSDAAAAEHDAEAREHPPGPAVTETPR